MVTNGEVKKGGEDKAPKPTRASTRWYGTSCSSPAASDEGMQPGRPVGDVASPTCASLLACGLSGALSAMTSRVHNWIFQGIDAIGCEVEADVWGGLRGGIKLVGLAESLRSCLIAAEALAPVAVGRIQVCLDGL